MPCSCDIEKVMTPFLLRKFVTDVFRLLVLFCFVMTLFGNSYEVKADEADTAVVEYLRLHVSADDRDAWLSAERQSWGPWLTQQNGFLGRDMFWDEDREEALLLIRWSSRENWKAISEKELEVIQEQFENLSREGTGKPFGNPFPLQYEGELVPQV